MKNFELWLNESGQVVGTKTSRTGITPSLVAGVLIDKDVPAPPLEHWFGKGYQSWDTYDRQTNERLIDLMEGLEKAGARYVLFSKGECFAATDENQTYISLLASGIEHFLRSLAEQHGDVYLKIILAGRFNEWSQDEQDNSAVLRIKERLMRAFYGSKLVECWRIVSQNTQDDIRLMAAEAVCVAFLRRKARRFRWQSATQAQSLCERVHACYERAINLPVFEATLNSQFELDLVERRMATAILMASRDTTGHVVEFYHKIIDALRTDYVAAQSLCYEEVSSRIAHMILEARSFAAARQILENLEQVFVPLLRQAKDELPSSLQKLIPSIEFDIAKQMVTLFAQSKNIHACDEAIAHAEALMPAMWNDYRLLFDLVDYRLQKSLAYVRMMQYDKALTETALIAQGLETLMGAAYPAGFIPRVEIGSSQLDEAHLLRLLTYVFISQTNPAGCPEAEKQFDKAKTLEFGSFNRKRASRYHSLFATNKGKFEVAWQCLLQSLDEEFAPPDTVDKTRQLEAICNYIKTTQDGALLEALMHHIAVLTKVKNPDGATLYHKLEQLGTLGHFYAEFEAVDENWQLTIWKDAAILFCLGKKQMAKERYNQVIASCFATEHLHNDTLRFIGIGAIIDETIALMMDGNTNSTSIIDSKIKMLNEKLAEIKAAYADHAPPGLIEDLLIVENQPTLESLQKKATLLPY